MKRFFCVFLSLLLTLTLCSGCSDDEEDGGGVGLSILSPQQGSTVDDFLFEAVVLVSHAQEGTVRILLDGQDRTAAFRRSGQGAGFRLTGSLLVLQAGEHTLEASIATPSANAQAASRFVAQLPPYNTPQEVVDGEVAAGSRARIIGTVHGATLRVDGQGAPEPQRYALMDADGTPEMNVFEARFGVGARMSEEQIEQERIPIPYPGDLVEAVGIVSREGFPQGNPFVIHPLSSLRVLSPAHPPLGDIAAACSQDTQCRDDLVCNRETRVCETMDPIPWGGEPRDVNGACSSDADCPAGQVCHDGYTIKGPSESPLFGAHYYIDKDVGRRLCQVPDRDAPAAEICPRTATVDDLMGGRFLEGKEVCIRGRVFVSVFNPGDRDTHSQMIIQNPILYPIGDPPIVLVQAAAENSPPYKDPENPQGRLGDLPALQEVIVLGTVKWDNSHEWVEIHPYKWFHVVTDGS